METEKPEILVIQEIFREDLVKCLNLLAQDDSDFNWRTFVRTFFASVEGTCFLFKMTLLHYFNRGEADISDRDVIFLLSKDYKKFNEENVLKDKFYPTKFNVKKTIELFVEFTGEQNLISFSNHGWRDLQQFIKIRNRFAHPKKSSDLKVKKEEVDVLLNGGEWWSKSVVSLAIANYKIITNGKFDVKKEVESKLKGL